MSVKDSLGDRMKQQYEDRTRYMLPRRTYTIIRIDGKAFHTFTKHYQKPWDQKICTAMDVAAETLCEEAQGAAFAYVQSDEISVLLTDFAKPATNAWFDGNVQKICSIAASIVTASFNKQLRNCYMVDKFTPVAFFDARCFTIPDHVEVANYFVWRQNDCIRNSISTLAQSKFSHRELEGKSQAEMQEMLFQRQGINWSKESLYNKNGRVVMDCGEEGWTTQAAITFTKNHAWLAEMIP